MKAVPAAPPIGFYEREALSLAPQYDSVSFEDVHHSILHYLPSQPSLVLDVGAGSGRDAAALAGRGHRVVAVEPAASLRALGETRSPEAEWVADGLPALSELRSRNQLFDFILCSAVLMSIAPADLDPSFASLAELLKPEGKIAVSVRAPTRSEARLFYGHSIDDLLHAASRAGLRCVDNAIVPDALARGYVWTSLVFIRE